MEPRVYKVRFRKCKEAIVNIGDFFRVWPFGTNEIHTRMKYCATQNKNRVAELMEMRANDRKRGK